MEVLSDVLRGLRVRGSVYFCDRLEPPWSLPFDDEGQASFHLVRRGHCWVRVDDEAHCLGTGDLVYVGPGVAHRLDSGETGVPSAETLLLCGYSRFETAMAHPLLASFPRFTIVRQEELLEHPWLKSTLDQLSAEYLSQRPGAEVVVDRLTEVVLVELIRLDFCRGERAGFMRALNDHRIARALELLHERPGHPWTLEHVGREVGMSRAGLAKRFKELVGEPLFDYLTDLRMRRARELLSDTPLPIHEVADRVGYASDIAFTKAFRKRTGSTPTRFRKAARAASPESGDARS